jgi:hypothetical protein
VIEGYIVLENFGNGGLFENRLPRAFRFASSTIDAFLGVDVELIGKFFFVSAGVFIDAVNRTNADASCIETVSAKTSYSPRHFAFLLPLNDAE